MRVTKGLYLITILLFIYSQFDVMTQQPTDMLKVFVGLNFFLILNSFFCTATIAVLGMSKKKLKFWNYLLSFWMAAHIVLIITFSLCYLDYILIILLLCFLGSLVAIPIDDKLSKRKRLKK